MSEKVYQIIQEQILKKLDEGTVPWRKTWNGFGKPKNIISNKEYRGFNWLMLSCSGYTSPFWMTKKQCQQLGGKIDYSKEKSTMIIFWKFLESQNDKGEVEKRFPMLRYYHVYNYNQTTGITLKPEQIETFDPVNNDPIENCENLVNNWKKMPEIVFGKRPSYNPTFDHIGMPKITDFHSSVEYYATLFHEMGHSTMHLTRLNRTGLSYAKEELVAEMSACFLCGVMGIENLTIENSATYIQSWRQKISEDPKLVIQAASMAQKASNYIQNIYDFTEIKEEIADCA